MPPRTNLGRLDAPVLMLLGECDRIIQEVTAEHQEIFRNATLVVVDGVGYADADASRWPVVLRAFLPGESLPIEHGEPGAFLAVHFSLGACAANTSRRSLSGIASSSATQRTMTQPRRSNTSSDQGSGSAVAVRCQPKTRVR